MKKLAKKRARKTKKKIIGKKHQQQKVQKKKTQIENIVLDVEQKFISLISSVFKKYSWKKIKIHSIPFNDKDSGIAKIRVTVLYLKRKTNFDFLVTNNFKIIYKIHANAYRILYCVGSIKSSKDEMILYNFLDNVIKTQRKGDESEFLVCSEIKRILSLPTYSSSNYDIVYDEDLDALSIDLWLREKDTLEKGHLFQIKSSLNFIKKSKKEFKEKKYRDDLDGNRFLSLIMDNFLHYLAVVDGIIFGLNEYDEKIPLEKYLIDKNII